MCHAKYSWLGLEVQSFIKLHARKQQVGFCHYTLTWRENGNEQGGPGR
jgi:hypothetical protein